MGNCWCSKASSSKGIDRTIDSQVSSSNHARETIIEQPIIPGLPDDLALRCIAKLSHGFHGTLECVSKGWRDLVRSEDYSRYKAINGWSGSWLFVLTSTLSDQWVAYDPDADRWHPLPRNIEAVQDGWCHSGFAYVCVSNCLLVIGGFYVPSSPPKEIVVTGDVVRFDPFKKEWKRVASMRTPRARFACAVVSGKVYVAGGRSVTNSISSAEVYDPVADRWEELPAIPTPQGNSLRLVGLSYKGSFNLLSYDWGITEQFVFNPLEMSWSTVVNNLPTPLDPAAQVMKNDRQYTIGLSELGGSLIKTRDTDEGEWYTVGSVPCPVLPNHPGEPPLVMGLGFAALRDELYVVGGIVVVPRKSDAGRLDIVRLSVAKVCNPLDRPLNWRETKPMCFPAGGSIIGCVSLEESSPP